MDGDVFLHRLVVDGEEWEVLRDPLGQFRFVWISGWSGFTSRLSSADTVLPREVCEHWIRDYMSEVNPETGYLD